MDSILRELERTFRVTDSPEDGLAYYRARFRVELLPIFGNVILDIAQNGLDLSEVSSYSRPQLNRITTELRLGAGDIQLIYGLLCHTKLGLDPDVYFFDIWTLSKRPVTCGKCRKSGPHKCIAAGQRENRAQAIPGNYPDYNLDNHLRLWMPDPDKQSEKGQRYIYSAHKWAFRPATSNPLWNNGEWYLASISEAGSYDDAKIPRNKGWFYMENIPYDKFGWTQKPTEAVKGKGHSWRGRCRIVLDSLSGVFPLNFEHGLPQQPPNLVTGPCTEYRELPKGGTIYIPGVGQVPTGGTITVMGGPGMSTEQVIDTSTQCGHGYTDSPWGNFPLCPPTWSDTNEIAAKYCEQCLKPIPLDTRTGKFTICSDCVERMRRQNSLEEYLDYQMETEQGENYYCSDCETTTDNYEEEEVDGEMVLIHDPCGEVLSIMYSCPYCENEYHETPQEANDCCTKITPIDWPDLIKDYP